MTFRLHILYDFKDGPWGGGNQFLKALRQALQEKGNYTDDPFAASAILLNSHHFGVKHEGLDILKAAQNQNPRTVLLHRIDGPIGLIRGGGFATDRLIFKVNRLLANGTIFQTHWSANNSNARNLIAMPPVTSIMNAPDPAFFYPALKRDTPEKFKLIATSWAANARKGFDIYRYLDTYLDFSRYDMTFVGNAPFPFQNIRHIPPVPSAELGQILRQHDIYITASVNDPCSNALCEALHCALPALARNSGGHPEILGAGGLTFESAQDVLLQLDALAAHYQTVRAAIALPSLSDIADRYLAFAKLCAAEHKASPLSQKNIQSIKTALRRHHTMERVKNGLLRRLGLAR